MFGGAQNTSELQQHTIRGVFLFKVKVNFATVKGGFQKQIKADINKSKDPQNPINIKRWTTGVHCGMILSLSRCNLEVLYCVFKVLLTQVVAGTINLFIT